MTVRILLADDHRIVRQGLVALLEKPTDLQVAATAEDGRKTVRLAKELRPDLVIMDIAMPVLNGIEACRQILAEAPHTKVIALSMHSDRRFVTGMLQAGASGYLLKDCAYDELMNAITQVKAGHIYLSPRITSTVVEDYVRKLSPMDSSVFQVLTAREREVLQLLAEGKTTKEIAASLHVSVKTIETHRKQIMDKLNVHSLAELTKYAIREGLTFL